MTSTYPRRDVLGLCGVAFGLGTAGCLGDPPDENDPRETTESAGTTPRPITTRTESPAPERTTVGATDVSDEEAKERALAAEEEFLTGRLRNASCLADWGTYPTTASERATVVERSADGVSVDVTHPYSYSTEPTEITEGTRRRTEADGASNARYLVTADGVERVRGDNVSPC